MLVCAYSGLMAQKLISTENRWYYLSEGSIYVAFFKDSTLIDGQYYFRLYTPISRRLNQQNIYFVKKRIRFTDSGIRTRSRLKL
jgi:hypothetical protein